jgi:hypothetical protein
MSADPYSRITFEAMGRRMEVSIGHVHSNICVAVYQEGHHVPCRMLAYTTGYVAGPLDDRVHIDQRPDHAPALWIGRTAFDLTEQEAEQLRAFFMSALSSAKE